MSKGEAVCMRGGPVRLLLRVSTNGKMNIKLWGGNQKVRILFIPQTLS